MPSEYFFKFLVGVKMDHYIAWLITLTGHQGGVSRGRVIAVADDVSDR